MSSSGFFPTAWTHDLVSVADVLSDETDLIARLHRTRSDIGTVDKSFLPVEIEEYAELVRSSTLNESEGKPFRLQVFRDASGRPCGYFHAFGNHPFEDCLFISMFFVVPGHARQGIGRSAVEGIKKRAADLGFERILLNVFLANRDALSFWIDQGFDRIDKFRRSEESGVPDRLILELKLRSDAGSEWTRHFAV